MTDGRRARLRSALWWVAALALPALLLWSLAIVYGLWPMDEGLLLVYPERLLHGHLPYRSFWMSYPPGILLYLAPWYAAGASLLAERVAAFVLHLAIVVVATVLVSPRGRPSPLWAFAFALLVFGTGPGAFTYPAAVLCFVCAVLVLRDTLPARALAIALLLAAGLMRLEAFPAGALGLALRAWLRRDEPAAFRRAAGDLACFLLGAAAVLAASTLAFGMAFWRDTFIDPILRISPGRRLPLSELLLDARYLPLALAAAAAVALGLTRSLRRATTDEAVPLLTAVSLVAAAQVLQRADWQHFFSGALPAAILAGRLAFGRRGRRPLAVPFAASTAGAGLALLALTASPFTRPARPLGYAGDGLALIHGFARFRSPAGAHWLPMASRPDVATLDALRDAVRARAGPGDTLYVGLASHASRTISGPTFLYWWIGLPPATRYLEFAPGLTDRASVQRAIVRDLQHCRLVVLWTAPQPVEPNASRLAGSTLLDDYLTTHYRVAGDFGPYRLLVR